MGPPGLTGGDVARMFVVSPTRASRSPRRRRRHATYQGSPRRDLSAIALVLSGTASARVLEMDTFHDEFTDRIARFCDVDGLTVVIDFTVNGRFLVDPEETNVGLLRGAGEGPSGDHRTASGGSAPRSNLLDKDRAGHEQRRWILTVSSLRPGTHVYDENGTAMARDPGQIG